MRVVDVNGRDEHRVRGVAETWVVSDRERRGDPPEAPVRVAEASLRPQLVLVPAPVAEIRARMERHAVAGAPRVARIFPGPGGHGYPLVPWVLSPIPEVCERDGWALAVDPGADGPYPWVELVELARCYPGLPFVAVGAPFDDRTARAALDATANLVLETSRVVDGGQRSVLAAAMRSAGPHRFVFGSAGTARTTVPIRRGLSSSELEALLAGTADALGGGTWKATWM